MLRLPTIAQYAKLILKATARKFFCNFVVGLYSQHESFKIIDPILYSWVTDAESKLKQGTKGSESFLEKFLEYGVDNGSASQHFTGKFRF